jgi:hypothetical protein
VPPAGAEHPSPGCGARSVTPCAVGVLEEDVGLWTQRGACVEACASDLGDISGAAAASGAAKIFPPMMKARRSITRPAGPPHTHMSLSRRIEKPGIRSILDLVATQLKHDANLAG